jgi:hypothetical protein
MRHRPRWGLLTLGALMVAALYTFPLWRSAFSGEAQTMAFPLVEPAERAVLLSLPNREFAATAYAAMLTAVPVPTEAYPPPVPPEAQPIRRGAFTTLDAVHTAQGTASFYRLIDDSVLLRLDDFAVTNAPQLNVYLSGSEAPRTIQELGGLVPEFLVGALVGNSGPQQFTIPRELRLERYRSVVIVSESLQMIYSFAELR